MTSALANPIAQSVPDPTDTTVLSAAAFGDHGHAVSRTKRQHRLRLDRCTGSNPEPPPPGDGGEHERRFRLGERSSDACPRTRAERHVRVPRPVVDLQPPFRAERIGVTPPPRVVVEEPRRYDDDRALRDGVLAGAMLHDRGSSDRPGRRTQSERFRDDGVRVTQAWQVFERWLAVVEDVVELGVEGAFPLPKLP